MDVEWMLRIGAAVSGGWNEKEEVVLRLYYDMECNNARTFMSGRFILFFFICNYSEPCKLCNSSAMAIHKLPDCTDWLINIRAFRQLISCRASAL